MLKESWHTNSIQTQSMQTTKQEEIRKFKIYTLGCRLNFFEADGIATQLVSHGYKMIQDHSDTKPDHIIINTCTVTNKADLKNRSLIRQAILNYPGSKVWVTGCYAETDREAIEKIPGVYGVFGNSEKSYLSYRILQEDGIVVKSESNEKWDRFSYSNTLPQGHTRAYLKIQDGCNRKCSYCKIPLARGKGVSRNFQDVLDQIRFLQDSGIGEIILTGVNLGWYRNDSNEKSFIPLLESILKILDYSRLRLSSIEPPDVGVELAELMTHPRFCRFLHIPLQSGSSAILKKMRRTYNPTSFCKRIEKVLEKEPNLFLGTDVIVGFPGEGEAEFQETLQILKDYPFSRIHAFPYSPRKGTEAEGLGDPIPKTIKKERIHTLMSLSSQNLGNYIKNNLEKELEAILEMDGRLVTDNYLKGFLLDENLYNKLKIGQFLKVKISKVFQNSNQFNLGMQLV